MKKNMLFYRQQYKFYRRFRQVVWPHLVIVPPSKRLGRVFNNALYFRRRKFSYKLARARVRLKKPRLPKWFQSNRRRRRRPSRFKLRLEAKQRLRFQFGFRRSRAFERILRSGMCLGSLVEVVLFDALFAFSPSRLAPLLRSGCVRLNGKPLVTPHVGVSVGDVVQLVGVTPDYLKFDRPFWRMYLKRVKKWFCYPSDRMEVSFALQACLVYAEGSSGFFQSDFALARGERSLEKWYHDRRN